MKKKDAKHKGLPNKVPPEGNSQGQKLASFASFGNYFSRPENLAFWMPNIYGALKGAMASQRALDAMAETSDVPFNKKLLNKVKGTTIIDTNKKVNSWANRNIKDKWKRAIFKKQIKATLKNRDNAYALIPDEGTETAVVVPSSR